jgi:fused signal recognition particle receptor
MESEPDDQPSEQPEPEAAMESEGAPPEPALDSDLEPIVAPEPILNSEPIRDPEPIVDPEPILPSRDGDGAVPEEAEPNTTPSEQEQS